MRQKAVEACEHDLCSYVRVQIRTNLILRFRGSWFLAVCVCVAVFSFAHVFTYSHTRPLTLAELIFYFVWDQLKIIE